MKFLILVCCFFWSVRGDALAGNSWPQFRGPTGDGHSDSNGLPIQWSETNNVKWKTAIPGEGWSSPVIEGDQVWMQTATDEGKSLRLVSVNKNTGALIHNIEVFRIDAPEPKHAVNSHASPTPVVENGRVYLSYGMYGVACVDSKTGKVVWENHELKHDHDRNGPGSSPTLYQNLFILNCDGTELRYVAALEKADGTLVWKKERSKSIDRAGEFKKAYSTPQIVRFGNQDQLLSVGAFRVSSYRPATGEEIWSVDIPGFSNVPRPVASDGLAFICTGFTPAQLWAIRMDGKGDVTKTHVVWKYTKQVSLKPSILVIGDLLYMVSDNGVASCIRAKTGEPIWSERVGGEFSASPIYAHGRIYLFSHQGATTVLQPGEKFQPLSTNQLDGGFMASPAIADNALILRTKTHLYRVEQAGSTPAL